MNNIIDEIRKKQDEMIVMVNSTFEEIIRKVLQISTSDICEENEYDAVYPLTNTAGFKGKKVIAVIINGEREIVPTWKIAVQKILEEVLKDREKKLKMYQLCDKLLGRKRTRLSSSPTGMRSPLELREDLYVETHYDTETLMNLLLQILNEISYDYSKVQIVVKN